MNPTDYLMNVPQENYFRLADGRIIKNLEELYVIVRDSGDTVFFDHVTPDRNDFASWIKECVKHQDLHNRLMPIKDRQSFLNVLNQEVATLKNPKVSETMKFFSEDYDPKKDNQSTQQPASPVPVQNSTQSSATPVASTAPAQQSVAPVAQSAPATPSSSSDSELDFEQVLGTIIQEIQEEIFFWQ